MEIQRKALEKLLQKPVQVQGSTDLTLGDLKFSGNSQRRKRKAFLFHGTFLLDFDIGRIEKYLRLPPKKPAYRHNRPHRTFLTNLGIPAEKVKKALASAWGAENKLIDIPRVAISNLAKEKYSDTQWNLRR
jgi:lipoate-protein ligase A